MKKRFYHPAKKPAVRRAISRSKQIQEMAPGADKSLRSVFGQIGIPNKTPFIPDPYQEEAVKTVIETDCMVTAPTGAGKTWIAETAAQRIFNKKGRIWYATPLKALTNSIYTQFKKKFGENSIGILTGDIKENADAPIIIGTTEILRNQLYDAMHTGENLEFDLVILDEAHYLGDPERGVVWEEILIYLPVRVPLLMLSATIGNPHHISRWLESIRSKPCRVIEETRRPVPLFSLFLHPSGTLRPLLKKDASPKKRQLHKTVLDYMKQRTPQQIAPPGRLPRFSEILTILDHYQLLPAIFFLKSRAECDQAIRLCTSELIDAQPERKQNLDHRIQELVANNPHLANHRQLALLKRTATASHHSGQLPGWKVVVETLMAEGLLDAMFATSTVAAGVNFPARSVVILNSDRFNGKEFLPLNASEFQQMTGRAGRRGMDNIGFAVFLPGKFMDLRYVAQMLDSPPLDINSQIRIDFSMVLNLLLSHAPAQVKLLLDKSFASHMISHGGKGNLARKTFGRNLEYLWEDFLDHLDFLQEEKFVTEDGTLTEDGIWASSLRIDTPLLVAQSLRLQLFPDNDPVLLASVMASFVNDREFDDDDLAWQLLPDRLTHRFIHLRKGLKPFALKMIERGFDAPNLYIQPAVALYHWALDESWENVVKMTGYAEGDLARLILRTSENLRQLTGLKNTFPIIAKHAKESINSILKQPVITFHDDTISSSEEIPVD